MKRGEVLISVEVGLTEQASSGPFCKATLKREVIVDEADADATEKEMYLALLKRVTMRVRKQVERADGVA